jgi:hypothetical protein
MLAKKQGREERRVASGSSRGIPHCRTCSELGHNRRTCIKDAAISSD